MPRIALLIAGLCVAIPPSQLLPADETETETEPAAAPTHVEVEPIRIELGEDGKIETMAMDRRGRLLLAVSWVGRPEGVTEHEWALIELERLLDEAEGKRPAQPNDEPPRSYAIRFVDESGKVVQSWPLLDQVPHMIHATREGDIYLAGNGRMTQYDEDGKLLGTLSFADVEDGAFADWHASGITVDTDYVFLAFGDGRSLRATESIVRFRRDLTEPKLIVETQFGCCAHIDLDVRDGELLVAENSRHRVNRFDFEGQLIERWGRRNRTDIAGFEACCNPVNIDFADSGVLYTAESGVGRVKRYSQTGEYLGLVGYVDTTKFDRGSRLAAMSCYIPIEVAANEDRIYVMDVRANFIRVLVRNTP